ncbi:MAG: hypothetical protein ACKOXB_14865 [Flavobacteriales bacterium]
MKKNVFLLLMISTVVLILTGCPVSISYALDEPGKNSIDKNLLGTWVCDTCSTFKKVEVKEGTEKNSYDITVLEKGDSYTAEGSSFTSYVTTIGDYTFLYNLEKGTTATYYTYCYKMDGTKKVTLSDIGLLVGGTAAVTSTETYRQEVSASMSNPRFLSSPQTFVKQ